MNDKKWNSTPDFRTNKILAGVGGALVGFIMLFVSIYMLATELYFFHNATQIEAPIVEVRHEYVPAGRVSVLGYVPVVELPSGEKIRVDTFSRENIYSIGTKIRLLCDFSGSKRCIRDSFFECWWGLVNLAIALLFLIPSLLYVRKAKQQSAGLSVFSSQQ